MTKKTKWWLIGGGCGFLVVLTVAVVGFLALLMEPVKAYPVPKISLNDVILQTRLIQSFSEQIQTGQNGAVQLQLRPEQVEMLIRLALIQYAAKLPEDTPMPLKVTWQDDGRLELEFMHDSGCRWLFGGGIRVHTVGRLACRSGVFVFDADSLRVGAFAISGSMRERVVAEFMAQLNQQVPAGGLGLDTVVCENDGSVTVVFDVKKGLQR